MSRGERAEHGCSAAIRREARSMAVAAEMAGMKSSRLEYARDISSVFAKVMRQYRECSDEVQKVVDQMIEILNASESDDTERDMALSTLTEALFPDYDDEEGGDNVLGMELT